jgi:hypothetical protein
MQIYNRRNEESKRKVVDKRKNEEGRAGVSPLKKSSSQDN